MTKSSKVIKKKNNKKIIFTPDLFDDNIEYNISLNVVNKQYKISPFAFRTKFTNSLNYIESTLDETKKNMIPSIGSKIKNNIGEKFQIDDLRKIEVEKIVNEQKIKEITYIFDLILL